jgi:hypothetical protein
MTQMTKKMKAGGPEQLAETLVLLYSAMTKMESSDLGTVVDALQGKREKADQDSHLRSVSFLTLIDLIGDIKAEK